MSLTKVQKEGIETLINNNADNRVITGSGTANTLNGESNVVIDANGKLGIGTTSPGLYDVTVYRSSGTSRGRFHTAGTSGNDYADLAVQAGSNYAQMFVYGTGQVYMTASAPATMSVGNVADSSLYLTTNNTIRQTITNNGNVGIGTLSPAKKLDVNGEIRASSGILFGSDTAAANALDDYETGTWTPTQGNFSTFSLSSGQYNATYTKIGNIVHFRFEQSGGELAWSQAQYIGGLPFTVAKNGAGTWTNNYPNSGGEMLIYGSNILYFSQSDEYNTSSYKLVFSGTYETNQ